MTVVIQSSMFGLIEEGEQVVVDFCGAFLVRAVSRSVTIGVNGNRNRSVVGN
ncbi:MAG: hypothetical protein QOJ80_2970 [Mycobacterium sp.]|jgi:hypothetical protein|nr:hypothetical protein [Mycobacterium sp.]